MRRIALAALGLAQLTACGSKCPDGYTQNDETKQCIRDGAGGDTAGTDEADTDTDTDADTDTDTDTDADTDTDTDTDTDIPDDTLDGELIIQGLYEGRLYARTAFSFEKDGVAVVYMSGSEHASCQLVADHLGASETPVDPTDLFVANSCNVLVKLNSPSWSWTEAAPLDVTDLSKVIVSAECPFGGGAWTLDTVGGQQGWYWENTGGATDAAWYTAAADDGTIEGGQRLSGSAGHEVLLNIDGWSGTFPQDNDLGSARARGTGKGMVYATWCAALEDSVYFQ